MPSEARVKRFNTVLDQRLSHVRCAIEALYHRHNVSAVLRTCDSLGLHHVHLVEGHFKAVKGAARGAERWLDLHHHADPASAIQAIKATGCSVWVADLSPDGVPPQQVPIDKPVCLWFGAELTGVSAAALEAADGVMTIPMHGFAQSLNISVSAAIAMSAICARVRAELGDEALLSPELRQATWDAWMQREFDTERRTRAVSS